jgi:hypothetical protein
LELPDFFSEGLKGGPESRPGIGCSAQPKMTAADDPALADIVKHLFQ